jgi:aarF domain-containing kinase
LNLLCREAANAIRFAELFSFMPEVMVPKMFTEWTTSRVLVMEWIEGERLRSASRQAPAAAVAATAAAAASSSSSGAQVAMRQQLIQQQRSSPKQVAEDLRLVEIGVRCSLEQMLEEG